MEHQYTTAAIARRAGCSPGLVTKLRAQGVLAPPKASDGTHLFSDKDVEIVRARVQAWRDRPRKAGKAPE